MTLAKELPFTFVDHALRHGDSLVGLDAKQLRGFHWAPTGQIDLFRKELDAALDDALGRRQEILDLATETSEAATREKEWLLDNADDALERVRLVGDLVVGAFFAKDKKKAREDERKRRLSLVEDWLKAGGDAPPEVVALRDAVRKEVPVFHWPLEFPEIFFDDRPDPLDGDRANGAAMMDAFVGNPPFMGGRRVRGMLGDAYTEWLGQLHDASKNADL